MGRDEENTTGCSKDTETLTQIMEVEENSHQTQRIVSHFDSFSAPFPGSQPFSQGSFIACKGFLDMDCHSDGIHCPTMLG
ncbi:hypothetical protein M8J77_007383 [Diaphorina citri]|nr:hypothetical protein M8J77_007383 [Diaphorina citri]